MTEPSTPFLIWLKRESFRFADGLTIATIVWLLAGTSIIIGRHFGLDLLHGLDVRRPMLWVAGFYLLFRTVCAIVDYAIWAFFMALSEFTAFSLTTLGGSLQQLAAAVTQPAPAAGEPNQRGSAVAYLHDLLESKSQDTQAAPLTPEKDA